jgi:hypothetical protein
MRGRKTRDILKDALLNSWDQLAPTRRSRWAAVRMTTRVVSYRGDAMLFISWSQ